MKSGTMLRTKGLQVIPDGDRLILELPGGAGMGDACDRDPAPGGAGCAGRTGFVDNARALYRVAVGADGQRGHRGDCRPARLSFASAVGIYT